ncbi:MAG: insulinase family protein [Bacteroidales bacterium]|nr:insulinase family protein [Bacteroidales bacterium]
MEADKIPVNRFTLPNGLRVVHSPDSTTAMVAVNLLYNVGARDESPQLSGMAHLFEHLMFGGSEHVDSFDNVLEDAGGKSNAWTSNDFTNFYDTLPAQNIETALYLESDRMLALDFKPKSLEVQKGVVIEEFKQTHLDRPYGDLSHILRRLVYRSDHPYSWPTIGKEISHIERVTMDDVKHWFYSHYAPNNAILSISGNIDFDTTCRLVEKWFADVPRREIAQRQLPDDCFNTGGITHTAYGKVPVPVIVMAWPMDPYGTTNFYLADALTDVLSLGRSCRFSRNLIYGKGQGIFNSVDASVMGSEHPGILMVQASLTNNEDATIDQAIDLIVSEMTRVGEPGNLSEYEFERVQNRFEANFRFANTRYLERALQLAMCEYHGQDINRTIADRRSLTPQQVETFARTMLANTKPITVIYRPENL